MGVEEREKKLAKDGYGECSKETVFDFAVVRMEKGSKVQKGWQMVHKFVSAQAAFKNYKPAQKDLPTRRVIRDKLFTAVKDRYPRAWETLPSWCEKDGKSVKAMITKKLEGPPHSQRISI